MKAGDDLQAALDAARPGQTIVLEAGATFVGNFMLPPKSGKGWIYIEGSALDKMAPPGQRTSPSEAKYMPKIETGTALAAISVLPSSSNYRLVGLEITPEPDAPRAYQLVNIDYVMSSLGARMRNLVQEVAPQLVERDPFPRNIVIDRCYIHGSDTQDVRQGVVANGISVAVVDSYISDIHDSTMDSQAVLVYQTPGPIKIANNFLSSTTENVLFGGAGGYTNRYVPSDVEVRGNHLFKPLEWRKPGITQPPHPRWSVKNNLEFKNVRRALVTGNIMENNWPSAQTGVSVLLTPRTSDSGNVAVVEDITIENNILKNVTAGFNGAASDDLCGAKFGHPNCTNPGSSRHWKIDNNLVLMSPSNDTAHHWGLLLGPDITDLVFQHNSVLMSDLSGCPQSVFFNGLQKWPWPPTQSYTHDVWMLDNALCGPPTGLFGGQGALGLNYYMGDPPPLNRRFMGNVMATSTGNEPFPPKNSVESKFKFADPATGNYQITSFKRNQTSDELAPGVDMNKLNAATQAAISGVRSQAEPALTKPAALPEPQAPSPPQPGTQPPQAPAASTPPQL